MRIIVSDSSCLIDLKKASLLGVFLSLPYEILIPNTLFEDELLSFTVSEKRMLIQGGLQVVDLPGQQVLRAREVITSRPRLSVHDGFAYALAEMHTDSILLTGDGELRILAATNNIEVHGVLWVVDEIHRGRLAAAKVLHAALTLLADDPAVRLPKRELSAALDRFEALL
jgi:predicted nucleic acid-binding protein